MVKEIELMHKLEKDLKLYKIFLYLLIIYLKIFFFKYISFDNLNLNIIKNTFIKKGGRFINSKDLIKIFLINWSGDKYFFSKNKWSSRLFFSSSIFEYYSIYKYNTYINYKIQHYINHKLTLPINLNIKFRWLFDYGVRENYKNKKKLFNLVKYAFTKHVKLYVHKKKKIKTFHYHKLKLCKFFYIKLFNIIFDKLKSKIYFILNNTIKKEIFINFLKRKNYLNVLYKNFYYIAFIKKKKSNIYFTITNRHGEVIISQSFGKVGLYSKKQRKVENPLKIIIKPALKELKKLNIYSIEYVNFLFFNIKQMTEIRRIMLEEIHVKTFKNYIPVPHNNRRNIKFKKRRRI